jgi:hypothetical protein
MMTKGSVRWRAAERRRLRQIKKDRRADPVERLAALTTLHVWSRHPQLSVRDARLCKKLERAIARAARAR